MLINFVRSRQNAYSNGAISLNIMPLKQQAYIKNRHRNNAVPVGAKRGAYYLGL